jgi:two-component system, cell cycle sensor histidine kinase and response regulator CckA
MDFISDGVMIADLHGRIIYVDTPLCRMLGARSPIAIFDQPVDLHGRLQFQGGLTFDQIAEHALKDGHWAGEATCQRDGHQAIMLDVRAIPLSDSGGLRLGTMLVARDVTREHSLEKQVVQSQQMELVENLSIGIAHEFKNLLTVIMAYASLLQDQMAGQPFQKDITKILEAAQTANELTSRLLSVTRHSAPKLEDVDVHSVLRDVVVMLQKTLPRNITLFAPEKTTLPSVNTDPAILYRALLNLCLNARDAMSNGGNLSIEVDSVNVEKEDLHQWPDRTPGAYISISVTDTGHGMTPEVKQHIFEPFFTTKKGGTGLGLTVVQHTIRAMGGWVTVYSEPNLGTCFRLYIPVSKQESQIAAAEEPDGAAIPQGTETILVVDDDPLALSITQRLLHKSGYTVWTASGGEEAITLYRQHAEEIHLVLLDVVMPYVNGEEVYHELKRINSAVAILVMSGFTPKTAERLLKASGARFLSKPFSRSRLCGEVRAFLDTKKK